MKGEYGVDFGNCGETVSPSDFAIADRTHAPYSNPVLMVVHFELVGLEKMSRTLENLVEMMSSTYFEFVVSFHNRFSTLF